MRKKCGTCSDLQDHQNGNKKQQIWYISLTTSGDTHILNVAGKNVC